MCQIILLLIPVQQSSPQRVPLQVPRPMQGSLYGRQHIVNDKVRRVDVAVLGVSLENARSNEHRNPRAACRIGAPHVCSWVIPHSKNVAEHAGDGGIIGCIGEAHFLSGIQVNEPQAPRLLMQHALRQTVGLGIGLPVIFHIRNALPRHFEVQRIQRGSERPLPESIPEGVEI